jgi:hypothetical protein
MLTSALESNSEKELKAALKVAKRVGLRWENDDGQTVCTELMWQVNC